MNVTVTPEAMDALHELRIRQVEIVKQRSGCGGPPDFVLNDGEFTSHNILLLSSLDGISFVTNPSNETLCESITIDWISGEDGGFTVSAEGASEGKSGCCGCQDSI